MKQSIISMLTLLVTVASTGCGLENESSISEEASEAAFWDGTRDYHFGDGSRSITIRLAIQDNFTAIRPYVSVTCKLVNPFSGSQHAYPCSMKTTQLGAEILGHDGEWDSLGEEWVGT